MMEYYAMTQLDNQDGKKKTPKPQKWRHINTSFLSKTSTVSEAQVMFFVMLVERLERSLIRYFRVRKCSDIPAGTFEAFERAPEINDYDFFIEGAAACGFVYEENPDFDFAFRNSRSEFVIPTLSFPQIRHYIYTLLRAEKWADGCGSPILEAFRSGALQAISFRLKTDRTLYAPS